MIPTCVLARQHHRVLTAYAIVYRMLRMTPSLAISRLLDAGWTETGLAEAVGSTQPTINRIKHGASPLYEVGAALVELARRELEPATSGDARKRKRA